jgi:glycosyltransferase involved in cell wall biosynthesis
MLMQKTDFPFEILVHDDASQDQSQSILQDYATRYPNIIRLITQRENQYSKGIKPWIRYVYPLCRGQYIAWCEGDDYWTSPYKLQRQVDCLRSNPEFFSCFHETMVVWEDGRSALHNNISEDRVFSYHDLTQSNFISSVSYLFRRQPGHPLPDWIQTVKAGDYALFFHNALHGPIYYLKDCMAVYRKHAGGIWSRVPYDQMILEGVKVMMSIDQGCNYNYHQEFQQGVARRLSKGNATELKRLLNQDPALRDALIRYQQLNHT